MRHGVKEQTFSPDRHSGRVFCYTSVLLLYLFSGSKTVHTSFVSRLYSVIIVDIDTRTHTYTYEHMVQEFVSEPSRTDYLPLIYPLNSSPSLSSGGKQLMFPSTLNTVLYISFEDPSGEVRRSQVCRRGLVLLSLSVTTNYY